MKWYEEGMRTFARLLTALTLTTGLAFVGAAPAVAAPARTAATGFAYQVAVDRTGGIAGRHDRYTVNWRMRGTDARWALTLATTKEYKRLAASYLPADQCCDRFAYLVTVRYTNGTTKKVSTVAGATAPAILWRVIHSTQAASAG
jgi:hypothetical protein